MSVSCDVVVPSAGRPSLRRLLEALAAGGAAGDGQVIVVDDRPPGAERALLQGPLPDGLALRVVRGRGRGPAAARNRGWRAGRADWVAFLDDDVVPEPGWRRDLARDLASLGEGAGGSQGRLIVPRALGGRATDWERQVAGLARARWATADMAYRRRALVAVQGFDERFPRAYREDTDLALRVQDAGWTLARGARVSRHPVAPARLGMSLGRQSGNADDVLMRALHGRGWRRRAGAPAGALPAHLVTVGSAVLTAAALAVRGRRARAGTVARMAALAWLAQWARFTAGRVAPGPRTPPEIAEMAWTSLLVPFAAVGHRLLGLARLPSLLRRRAGPVPDAVLFDRDGTLVHDVPYNGEPARVVAVPGARDAVARLRAAGVAIGVVSNQSGVARGLITSEQVDRVNARVEELLGPLGPWAVCPHAPGAGCECRKPAPGLVLRAAAELGVDPARCAVVGDIGADVQAARAAGARGVLVPTPRTRPQEVAEADEVAADLAAAVDLLLGARS